MNLVGNKKLSVVKKIIFSIKYYFYIFQLEMDLEMENNMKIFVVNIKKQVC